MGCSSSSRYEDEADEFHSSHDEESCMPETLVVDSLPATDQSRGTGHFDFGVEIQIDEP